MPSANLQNPYRDGAPPPSPFRQAREPCWLHRWWCWCGNHLPVITTSAGLLDMPQEGRLPRNVLFEVSLVCEWCGVAMGAELRSNDEAALRRIGAILDQLEERPLWHRRMIMGLQWG